jgi:two-component system cell cycle response regulator DivK
MTRDGSPNGQYLRFNQLALVIEDDPKLATIFAGALRQAGYKTEIILDGRHALERLAETVPTMVLLDIHLPYYSGMEILREIRADFRLARTKVMLATADALRAEQLRAEADLVLLKPISYRQLRDLAERFLPKDSPI